MQLNDAIQTAAALHALGRNAEALEHARRAIELDPASAAARITPAFIEGAISGYDIALAQIDALLAISRPLMEHWHAILPPGIMLDVRYEDVVADFEANARRLLAFCGLPWDDAVLRFYETSRPIRTASFKQARQPIYTTSVRAADVYRSELQPLIDALAGT